jgi:hypothetical protein
MILSRVMKELFFFTSEIAAFNVEGISIANVLLLVQGVGLLSLR